MAFDGTPYFAGETDFDINPAGVTEVVLTFATPVSAWGAEIVGGDGVEALMVSAKGGGGSLGVLDPVSDNTFLGFIADAGEQISSLRFFASQDAGGSREGFGMDNIDIVNVPEPSTACLFLLAGVFGLGLIPQAEVNTGRSAG